MTAPPPPSTRTMATPAAERALEGLGGIALHIEQLYREERGLIVQVSIFSVSRAINRGLPVTRTPGRRILARPSSVREWFLAFLRQAEPAQLSLFPESAQAEQVVQDAQVPRDVQNAQVK